MSYEHLQTHTPAISRCRCPASFVGRYGTKVLLMGCALLIWYGYISQSEVNATPAAPASWPPTPPPPTPPTPPAPTTPPTPSTPPTSPTPSTPPTPPTPLPTVASIMTDNYATSVVAQSNRNIFFLETSCAFKQSQAKGGVKLNARQACAVFSAAKANPNHRVYLFHSCPLHEDYFSRSSAEVQEVLGLNNFGIVPMGGDVGKWFSGTPLEGFENRLVNSSYPIQQSADALRMLVLWRYGGTYLDLDVVSLKDLTEMGENWSAAEDDSTVAIGLMNFVAGSPLVMAVLNKMAQQFHPQGWTSIGPSLLTNVLRDTCGLPSPVANAGWLKSCNFTVYPPKEFYPIHYSGWKTYFTADAQVDFGSAHAVHVWNKLSSEEPAPDNSPYARLAQQNCPTIYKVARPHF